MTIFNSARLHLEVNFLCTDTQAEGGGILTCSHGSTGGLWEVKIHDCSWTSKPICLQRCSETCICNVSPWAACFNRSHKIREREEASWTRSASSVYLMPFQRCGVSDPIYSNSIVPYSCDNWFEDSAWDLRHIWKAPEITQGPAFFWCSAEPWAASIQYGWSLTPSVPT